MTIRKRLPVICVIGSHEYSYPNEASDIGELVAKVGAHLLTGAGGGVMEKVSKAYIEYSGRKGVCIGIFPLEDMHQD